MFFIKYMDIWTHMHTRARLKRLSVTWLLVGGSVGTLDKEKRKDSREKGDERGPSACLAAMQQQPEGTREKNQGFPKSSSVPLPPGELCVYFPVNESGA